MRPLKSSQQEMMVTRTRVTAVEVKRHMDRRHIMEVTSIRHTHAWPVESHKSNSLPSFCPTSVPFGPSWQIFCQDGQLDRSMLSSPSPWGQFLWFWALPTFPCAAPPGSLWALESRVSRPLLSHMPSISLSTACKQPIPQADGGDRQKGTASRFHLSQT